MSAGPGTGTPTSGSPRTPDTPRYQRGHEQAPVRLDPDHHLTRISGVRGDQVMEPGDARDPLGQPPAGQPAALLVLTCTS